MTAVNLQVSHLVNLGNNIHDIHDVINFIQVYTHVHVYIYDNRDADKKPTELKKIMYSVCQNVIH